jgi:RHS repeat-associated protein
MGYDRYGNRSAQSIYSGCTSITCPTNSVTISASTNQISGSPYAYDLGGNMTNDGNNTLVYDAENRAVSATNGGNSGSYTYDGSGLRVQKASGGTTTVYIFSGGRVIAEYDNGTPPSSPSREYIYAGAALLAKIDSSGTNYYHQDHLSNRLLTDSGGNTVGQQGHFPFGEQWYPVPPASPATKWEFTTYQRDSESGNDYAMARYNINRLGRFSSPDLLPGSTSDPQSANHYSYSENDPTNLLDPSGMVVGVDCHKVYCGGGSPGSTPDPGWLDPTGDGSVWSALSGQVFPVYGWIEDGDAWGVVGLMAFGWGPTSTAGGGAGNQNCDFNIAVNNKGNMSSASITAIENQIAAVFAATPGSTVGVNFSFSGKPDTTLNLSGGFVGALFGAIGIYGISGPGTNPTVFVNAVSSDFGSDRLRVDGIFAAHELTHKLGDIRNVPYDSKNPNLMNLGDNPNQFVLLTGSGLPPGLRLTPDQSQKLLQACQKLHR